MTTNLNKIILGIDPGFSCTGFAILKKEGSKISLLDLGALKMKPTDPLPNRVEQFYNFILQKINQHKITDIALETSFLGKNAQNFLKLGYLRGTLYLLASQNKLNLHEFSPSEIKLAVTGFGGADKEQVARVVLRLFMGVKMPDKLDVTDALAIALCAAWRRI